MIEKLKGIKSMDSMARKYSRGFSSETDGLKEVNVVLVKACKKALDYIITELTDVSKVCKQENIFCCLRDAINKAESGI